jgi:quinoprotein glucose dehydrogenase
MFQGHFLMPKQYEAGHYSPARIWLLRLFGIILLALGLVLAIGGVKLVTLGGSPYYLVIGLALMAAGALVLFGRVWGLHVYLAAFAVTFVWALWEAGFDGWALVPRLVGPFILLAIALLLMPARFRDGGPTRRGLGAVASVACLAVLVIGVIVGNREASQLALPAVQAENGYFDDAIRPASTDWAAWGGGGGQRFSDLAQITPQNVAGLKPAWVYHTGDIAKNYGVEMTPLKIGDTVYGCTSIHAAFAVDAATGRQIWRFDPKSPVEYSPPNSACRGVSYYHDPQAVSGAKCENRIIWGTWDGKIFAVDAADGTLCEGFGTGGHVDLTQGLGEIVPTMVSTTSAPTIVRGVVVTSQQVRDGERQQAPSGVIRGWDAVTGELKWAWDMNQPDIITLPPEGGTYSLGSPNSWSTAVGDDGLGLVYLPIANPAGDYLSANRRDGEREYGSSVTAIDVATGKPAWSHQFVKNDVWDYDVPAQPSLVDFPTAGGKVPALIETTKMGDIFVLDRRTGALLTPVKDVAVPQGGVEPQERAATQQRSLFNSTAQPDLTEAQMWGMSPIDQMLCRIQFRQANYQGMFTPPTADKPYIMAPGNNGGSDWGSLSVDVRRGVIVANYNIFTSYMQLVPRAQDDAMGVYYIGDPRSKMPRPGFNRPAADQPYGISPNQGWQMPTGMLCTQPPYGGIRAVDLATGKTLWDRPFGTAERNGPFGIPSHLPLTIGTPNNGGALTTASGLIFAGATTDDHLRAMDLATGKTLWQAELPAGGQAAPMTYEEGGKQYVVIMAGGHHSMLTPAGDELIAYALP